MASNTSPKKIANIWTKIANPLRCLNNIQIEQMLNNSRYGNDLRLQVAYNEIEKNTPVFSICINKRISGVQGRSWDIIPLDDSDKAKNQAENVKRMFDRSDMLNKDGLTEAISHLVMSTFRGRAAVKPFVVDGGLRFKRLNNWNFLSYNGKNYWNPSSDIQNFVNGVPSNVQEIDENEVCYLTDEKPLDWIGLQIYLRQLIGEESYARWIEKYGLPPVIIEAPEGTPDTDLEKWNYRAQVLFEGGSGTLPSGAKVTYVDTGRGQDPFIQFLEHQIEQFCILATGGTLATIGGSSGLGSNVAEMQMDQFNSMVTYDCKRISNTLTQVAIPLCVRHLFGNDEILCRFAYVEQDVTRPDEYLDMALKLKELGISIDAEKLKEVTKLQIIDTSSWSPELAKTGWTVKDAISEAKGE